MLKDEFNAWNQLLSSSCVTAAGNRVSLERFSIVFRLTAPPPSLPQLHILPLELGSPAADTPALMKFAVPQESRTSPDFLSRQMWTGNPSSRLSSSAEFCLAANIQRGTSPPPLTRRVTQDVSGSAWLATWCSQKKKDSYASISGR